MTNFSEIFQKVADDYAESETSFKDWEAWKKHATSNEDNHAFNHLFNVMESLMIECCKEGFRAGWKSKLSDDFIDMIQETTQQETLEEVLSHARPAIEFPEEFMKWLMEALKKKVK